MGFKENHYKIIAPIKATKFLLGLGYTSAQTQKILDKSRLWQNKKVVQKKDILSVGMVSLIEFDAQNLFLKPLFVSHHSNIANQSILQDSLNFCIYNKPSKLLTHPKKLEDSISLLDQLRFDFGNASNPCHRLDYDTSGIVLCSLDKKSEVTLKNLFLERKVQKEYFAIVEGKIQESLQIQSEIIFAKKFGNLCIKGKANNLCVTPFASCDIEKIKEDYSVREDSANIATTLLVPLKIFNNLQEMQYFLQKSPYIFEDYNCDARNDIYQTFFDQNYKQADKKNYYIINCQDSYFRVLKVQDYCNTQKIATLFSQFCTDIFAKQHIDALHEEKNQIDTKKHYTLVKLLPLSGKTHQLRIHTSSINHKILGDTLYGLPDCVASFFLDSAAIVKHKNVLNLQESSAVLHSFCAISYHNEKLLFIRAFWLNFTSIFKFVSCALSEFVATCFFARDAFASHVISITDDYFQRIFFDFLLFFYAMPQRQEEIRDIMRIYYTQSNRLLLHAYKLAFLQYSFTYPKDF